MMSSGRGLQQATKVMVLVPFVLAACGSSQDSEEEESSQSSQALLNGLPAGSPIFDAVGVLLVPAFPAYGVCTGTLIGPSSVLTAKHCAKPFAPNLSQVEVVFRIGPDANSPRAEYRVVAAEWETEVVEDSASEVADMGSDLAVVHLASPVANVVPVGIGRLGAQDVGKRHGVIGYGIWSNEQGEGQRRLGWETFGGVGGNFADYAFGGLEGFIRAAATMPDFSQLDRSRLTDIYHRMTMLPKYQAYFGGRRGDSQTCTGDSGAPFFAVHHGLPSIVGVHSKGDYASAHRICDYGSVVSVFGPLAQKFVKRALQNAP